MISKFFKFFPLLLKVFFLKNVEIDHKSKYPDEEKPVILQRRTISKIAVALSGVLAAAGIVVNGVEVTPELLVQSLQVLIDAGIDIYSIVTQKEVMWAGLLLYGIAAGAFGELFKTKGRVSSQGGHVIVEKE